VHADGEKEAKDLERKLLWVTLIDTPGAILVGLALYGKFGANGNAFHPLLNNETVLAVMFAVGGAIMAWGSWQLVTIARRRAKLQGLQ
jgi:Na+-translocating ferredoxin:NAD+ oxidoreductase RnfD subunit